ncbi:MAG: flagellar biosynthetic protein FliR [bacterium]|nr:flagellar biosynthetic protein FliR [bacterium]MDW8163612.1 flagellar biosynthetic protein FliR [Candidatus Omnitrophota bacterium]
MEEKIYIFFLIWGRIVSYFLITMPFSYDFIPYKIRISFSFLFTILLFSIVPVPIRIFSISQFLTLFILQIIIGITLGFISNLIFYSIEFASYLIDYMSGMGIVTTVGLTNENVPIISNLLTILTILIFFVTDSHHILILGLKKSFFSMPISFNFSERFSIFPLYLYKNLFSVGIILSFPIVFPMFILEIFQAIIARIMPDLNIFIIGLPIRILSLYLFLLPFIFSFPIIITKLINTYIKGILL